MAEFCTCGSLKVKGNCSNKKCKKHIPGNEPATFNQLFFIKDLARQAGDETEYNFETMTKKEANGIIDELKEKVEFRERLGGGLDE